ncbi:MAG: hypothetical protein HAW67_01180 [Endozoicomonadaceae bacterium]|nr:hypothetical protein [Endozoicomonadaceae bacterium]
MPSVNTVMNVNLEAMRCPNAQITLNSLLSQFDDSDNKTLSIRTIEPSLLRSIKQRIAHNDHPMQVAETSHTPITEEHINLWSDKFDEEDYEDVTKIEIINIHKVTDGN